MRARARREAMCCESWPCQSGDGLRRVCVEASALKRLRGAGWGLPWLGCSVHLDLAGSSYASPPTALPRAARPLPPALRDACHAILFGLRRLPLPDCRRRQSPLTTLVAAEAGRGLRPLMPLTVPGRRRPGRQLRLGPTFLRPATAAGTRFVYSSNVKNQATSREGGSVIRGEIGCPARLPIAACLRKQLMKRLLPAGEASQVFSGAS